MNRPTDNPYSSLTIPQLYSYVFTNWGEAGLRQVMEHVADGQTTKEYQQEYADELRHIGLNKVADIVESYLDKLPSRFDESNCEYLKPPHLGKLGNQTNIRHWRTLNESHKQQYEAKRKIRNSPVADAGQ
jgi:hypothetical protein